MRKHWAFVILLAAVSILTAKETFAPFGSGRPGNEPETDVIWVRESFESTSFPPSGWAVDTANRWFRRTQTQYPWGYAPFEGVGMAEFNNRVLGGGIGARLRTPWFRLGLDTGVVRVSFAFFRNYSGIALGDSLLLQWWKRGLTEWQTFAAFSPCYWPDSGWVIIDTSFYPGAMPMESVYVGFKGKGYLGLRNIYIDKVWVYPMKAHDMACTDIRYPPSVMPRDTSFHPVITLRNYGTSVESVIPVTFWVDSSATPTPIRVYLVQDSLVRVTLNPSDTTQVTFSRAFQTTGPSQYYTMGACCQLPGEGNTANDTARGYFSTVGTGWTERRPKPGLPVYQTAGATDTSGHFYVIGGRNGSTRLSTVWRFNLSSNTWDTVAALPMPLSQHCAAFVPARNKIYVFGGDSATSRPVNALHIYDVENDAWTRGRDLRIAVAGNACAVINDTVFVSLGGRDTLFAYNTLQDTFRNRQRRPNPVSGGTMCSYGGLVWHSGGVPNSASAAYYRPGANTWTSVPNLPVGRMGHGMGAMNNRIYVYGGGVNTQAFRPGQGQVYWIDPANTAPGWFPELDMLVGQTGAAFGEGSLLFASGNDTLGLQTDYMQSTFYRPENDIAIEAFLAPTGLVRVDSIVRPIVRIRNEGSLAQSGFDIRLTIGSYSNLQTVGYVGPGDSADVPFNDWTANTPGFPAIRCTVMLSGDQDPTDNVGYGSVAVYNWIERFENTNGNYTRIPGNDSGWAWGAPAAPRPGPHSGTKVWGAPLIGNYANSANWRLTSIEDLAVMDTPVVAFWHYYSFESGFDAGNVTYSTNNGVTWNVLYPWLAKCEGYYQNNRLFGSLGNEPGYSGSIASWELAWFKIPVANGTSFRLRWRLGSDAGGNSLGWIVDDVMSVGFIRVYHDIGVTAIERPTSAENPLDPIPVQIRVENFGDVAALFSLRAKLRGSLGDSLGTQLSNVMLAPLSDSLFTMPNIWTPQGGNYTMRCSTVYAADEDRSNDTMSRYIQTGTVDIAALRIEAPLGSFDTSVEVLPSARLGNPGSVSVAFKTWFRITGPGGGVYFDSLAVAGLNPGAETTVVFPEWAKPHGVGRYFARCSAFSASDLNPANNLVRDSFLTTSLAPETIWTVRPDMPEGGKGKKVKDGGCLAYHEEGGLPCIYALKGNNRPEFYRYEQQTSSWTTRESIPAVGSSGKKKMVKKGASLVAHAGKLYAAKGGNTLEFWRYDPLLSGTPTYPWSQLGDIPSGAKNIKEGSGQAAVGNYIYLLRGSSTTDFYRYEPASGAWTSLASAPLGVSGKPFKNGSSVCTDGDNTVYALKGSYGEFYSYRIDSNTWTTLTTLPRTGSAGKKKVSAGSATAYSGGQVYALKGGNTFEFWVHDLAANQWSEGPVLPAGNSGKKVKGGGALAYARISSALYALKGNNTLEFFKLGLSAQSLDLAVGKAQQMSDCTQLAAQTGLRVMPNPVSDLARVSYGLSRPGNVSVRLYDVTGKLVRTLAEGRQQAGLWRIDFQSSDLGRGIYLLKLSTEDGTLTTKLIIE